MGGKWYYYVQSDEGRHFFETSDEFLEFLRDNDPCESGAEVLTEEQWAKIQANGEDFSEY